MTAAGFAGAVMVGLGYGLSGYHRDTLWLSVAGYVLHWLGDSLDGSLARHRGVERPSYGYFLDHSVDAAGNFVAMAGLGLSPFVGLDAALFALGGYMLLSIHAFLAARVAGEMPLSFLAAGPTELRLGLVAMTLTMILAGPVAMPGTAWSAYDAVMWAAGGLFALLFAWASVAMARRLARAEPPTR